MKNKVAPHRSIQRVCDYIAQNLDIPMSIEHLSDVAALSKYHFHRLFVANMHITVSKYILLARLKRASFELVFETDKKILDIAIKAGFDSAEAFSRAFKRTFNQTPSGFRSAPKWPQWHAVFEFTLASNPLVLLDVTVDVFPKTMIAFIEHRGAADRVYETAGQFVSWRKASGLSPIHSSKTFGIPNGDPNTMIPEAFRFKICGSVCKSIPNNAFSVHNAEIPEMRCAKVRHRGSHEALDNTINAFYQQWFVDRDEQPAEHPCFFQYINLIHEVDECDLLTDIFLPLR
ncbi:GyrI-like domain-containing protein [Pseudoalteromonas sp. MMG013]|uniref:AraC family transcriptional regulator n=1 Tax=Pseudoalteromonas sp. MMG013 TaxID=2822687 RepID=UPI0032B42330